MKIFCLPQELLTFEYFVKWGHDIGASADGRTAQSPGGI